MGASEDILEWSETKLSPWRQDALRRLASSASLTKQDLEDLLNLIRGKAGFSLSAKSVAPVPLAKSHLSSAAVGVPIKVKAIRNVTNVNRLVPSATLPLNPTGLSIIYGRNGSGKSGFVRILRTACRTRCDNPEKLKVLTDVYGAGGGTQAAEIVIDTASGEVVVPWIDGKPASDALMQVAVFDSTAAQLYVDSGSQIQFLPFGLALPYKLNELCLRLRSVLEAERKSVTEQLRLAVVAFEVPRGTKSQAFYKKLTGEATDAEIAAAAFFSPDDQTRLEELNRLLVAPETSAADLAVLAEWVRKLSLESEGLERALSDGKIEGLARLKRQATDARDAASLDASELFSNEPLLGVGGDAWRRLWVAARDYSISNAYPDRDFPVINTSNAIENCVLCHQPLSPVASDRLARFQAFVSGALATAADEAEEKVIHAAEALPGLRLYDSEDWLIRLEQIRKRKPGLADKLLVFREEVESRHAAALSVLQGSGPFLIGSAIASPVLELMELAEAISKEAAVLASADNVGQRQQLSHEQAELADQKILAAGRACVIKRRDLLKEDACYVAALAEVQTTGITKKANELVDAHLTTAVKEHYEAERKFLEISHLKIGLARKSDQTKAAFQTMSGTTLTKLTSDILSEGEQRALALAAFLTEVTVTEGSGPIVIDDPVSSLDRERGVKVAERLASEATKRQVIVFTHDLVFFNDLCREADARGVPTEAIALFADAANAGKIDPSGVIWKGLNVKKRLGRIKSQFAPLKKLYQVSPADYEYEVKNLYGRLRDTYERLVEECIFCEVVRRGIDRVETQRLRFVHLSDVLAIRFDEGMTRANTFSHDNPASETIVAPSPAEVEADLAYIEQLIADLRGESNAAEANRASMKKKG